jgi:transposase
VQGAACGTTTCAVLPPDVPVGAFGPRLQATVAVLAGRYRLSRREVVGGCTDVLGVPLAVGSVDHLCQATAQPLAAPVVERQLDLPPILTHGRRSPGRRWLPHEKCYPE